MGLFGLKINIENLKEVAKELGEDPNSYISLIKTNTETQKETKTKETNNDITN